MFDQRGFARMAHYAWKNEIGFHPDMFKEVLINTDMFRYLSENEIKAKANEICRQADYAKAMYHAAF